MINIIIVCVLELNGEKCIFKVLFIYLNDLNATTLYNVSNNNFAIPIDVLL